jgi:hypothetical protein
MGGWWEGREREGGGGEMNTLNELINESFSFCCLRIDIGSKNEYL